MNARLKGCICGVASAICYGTNPFGALGLKGEGITAGSMLFYRFSIAMVILGAYLICRRESLAVTRKEFLVLASLGVLMGFSSLGLFLSFNYMEAGVASTLLFVYPVMVAVIMAAVFRERVTITTVVAILLSLAGIRLLYQGNGDVALSLVGIMLVLFSSLTYAIYIIVSQKASLNVPPIKATFFVLVFGALTVFLYTVAVSGQPVQWLETPAQWGYALSLAVVSTIISLVLLTVAVKEIGSTPTAIMGALEPLTAVLIGVFFFHEHFTWQLAGGIFLILGAVMLIIMGNAMVSKPDTQS
jgi:drug/metabolite transporter (DMT)-like permease